jgi:hypothetical protein
VLDILFLPHGPTSGQGDGPGRFCFPLRSDDKVFLSTPSDRSLGAWRSAIAPTKRPAEAGSLTWGDACEQPASVPVSFVGYASGAFAAGGLLTGFGDALQLCPLQATLALLVVF